MPGAVEGIQFYLIPDWSALSNPSVWGAAFGQVCYSMSILFAIMISYGSFLHKKSNVVKDSMIIGGADLIISMLAGLVVFTALGFLSSQSGTPIQELEFQGVMLAFVTYPQALSNFPGGQVVATIFSLLFFLMLFALAIGSIFSLVETISTSVADKFNLNSRKTMFGVCIASFVFGLLFVTKAGLYWLDIIDHFINEFNLLFIGIFETIAIGWIFGAAKLRAYINETASPKLGKWWDGFIKFLCPAICIFLSASFLIANIRTPYGGYEQGYLIVGGWALVVATFAVALILPHVTRKKELGTQK